MTLDILLNEMLSEMRECIQKEDVKAGLPFYDDLTRDTSIIFVEWQQIKNNIDALKKYIAELDDEIAARVPWQDVSIGSEEGFNDDIPVTRFWTAQKDYFAANAKKWSELYNATIISEGNFLCYFTTKTQKNKEVTMEGAEEAKVCPSPASTLIMLQTRAKDSLKHELIKLNDFAVAHYIEVEKALGLKDTLPTSKRKRLMVKLKKIFHHQ